MIHGIGIDIVAINRMRDNIKQYEQRFAQKILSEKEMLEYSTSTSPAHYLAKHFAAKEALVKALGTGFTNGMFLKDIHIGHTESGQPMFEYNTIISGIISGNGITSCHLSISDEKDYACACVILEK